MGYESTFSSCLDDYVAVVLRMHLSYPNKSKARLLNQPTSCAERIERSIINYKSPYQPDYPVYWENPTFNIFLEIRARQNRAFSRTT